MAVLPSEGMALEEVLAAIPSYGVLVLQPAPREHAELERLVTERFDSAYPTGVVRESAIYLQGLRYAEVGRLEEARAALEKAGALLEAESGDEMNSRHTNYRSRLIGKDERLSLREQLVQAIEARAGP